MSIFDDDGNYIEPHDRDPEYCIECGQQLEGYELNGRTCFECWPEGGEKWENL